MEGRFLHCELPSGRWLGYPDPEIREKPTPWGEMRPVLTFMGIDQYSKQWTRQSAYGGLLTENVTQAVARDLMAEAMVRCYHSGIYEVILSVHDELIAEGDEGHPVHEFEQLMSRTSSWAAGLPVAAEGWSGFRYRK
jgi:DNA polymerase